MNPKDLIVKILRTLLTLLFLLPSLSSLRAEVIFGYRPGHPERRDLSRRGARFFATSDYGDRHPDREHFARGRTAAETGRFPRYNNPWLSDGEGTLFGLTFPGELTPHWADQFERFPDGTPLLDRVVVWWGENPPSPGNWAAGARTTDGRLVRIPVDSSRELYPMDRSTIRFDPMALETFYVGLKGGEHVEVRDIEAFLPAVEGRKTTDQVAVWHPGAFLAVYSTETPGMLHGLTPVNAYLNSHHTLFYHPNFEFDLFFHMTPFIAFEGETYLPVDTETPVTVESSPQHDRLAYALTFDLPEQLPITVTVRSAFQVARESSIVLEYRAEALPEGAVLGYRFLGHDEVFGDLARRQPDRDGATHDLTSVAGRTRVDVRGARGLRLRREPRRGGLPERVVFETRADRPDLSVAFSLPLGKAGRPRPELLNYTWREADVAGGDPGLAPFRESDLELLEEIRVGDPSCPYPVYDLSNDPVIDALREAGEDLRNQRRFGFMPLLDNPQAAAIPITDVLGESVRALPAKRGVYFRVDLQTRLRSRTPYLVVVEHAFDQRRRGTFHSIALSGDNRLVGQVGQVLRGGFETAPVDQGGFRTESVLCYQPMKRSPGGGRDSLVFTPEWAWQGWCGSPGPAIKTIRLYKVNRMPELPALDTLLPAPALRRNVTVQSELCGEPNPWWLFQWHRLVGYDSIWVYHDPMSRLLGGSSNLHRSFHPGTLAGNRLLFEAAAAQGLTLNLHLGQMLNLGFGDGDVDSFTGSFHGSYNGENVPFAPTDAELAHIAEAIRKVMEALGPYDSLQAISLADNIYPLSVWTERNLRDFRADTGVDVKPMPYYHANLDALLDGGPEVVRQWQTWAAARRRAFHAWLLEELRGHRPKMRLLLGRHWYSGLVSAYYSAGGAGLSGITAERLRLAGIDHFLDYLRLTGIDPALYADETGIALELEVDAQLRIVMQGPLPDYYGEEWFATLRDGFHAGGLSMMVNYNFDESTKPLAGKVMTFFKHREEFRRGLIEALLHADARNLTLPTYVNPWSGRITDLRQFAVPYRLLPFAPAQPFAGALADPAGQAVIRQHGERYALINAGDRKTTVTLTLPPDVTAVFDLSNGRRDPLPAATAATGTTTVSIPMELWSLRTLAME